MQPKNSSLLDVLKTRIAQTGPLPVSEYMSLALAHPEFGYYMRKDPLGASGDFTTAPEISQIFGELIGVWLAEQWQAMGKPQAALTELGPGRGTLMADMLRATRAVPGFHEAISVHLVETSPALRQKQWNTLAGKHPDIEWHADISELPAKPLLLAANEFFDALPVRQFVYTKEGWRERMVGLSESGALRFMPSPKPEMVNIHARLRGKMLKAPAMPGTIVECSYATEAAARAIGSHIDTYGGISLIIDYGHEAGTSGDTLQAVRDHRYADPLEEPGAADITAHVDFSAIRHVASQYHLTAYGTVPQGVFLSALGAQMRAAKLCQGANDRQKIDIISGLDRLLSFEQMGDLFKVLCLAAPDHPKPEGF